MRFWSEAVAIGSYLSRQEEDCGLTSRWTPNEIDAEGYGLGANGGGGLNPAHVNSQHRTDRG